MQDENGLDIYEGDIIRHKYDGDFLSPGGELIFVVNQDEDARYLNFDCLAEKSKWEIKVIGNIYENPKLIKETK